MAGEEDKSSKTEEATDKKRQNAFKEGNFAKAEEIQVVFGLIAAFIVILFTAETSGRSLAELMAHILGHLASYPINSEVVGEYGRQGVAALSAIVIPALSAAFVASILAGGLQSGFRPTPKAMGFKPDKLNPISGFKQKYGKSALVKFGLDLLKFLVIAGVVFLGILRVTRHEIFTTRIAPIEVGKFIYEATLYLLSLLIVALGFVAALNFLYQKYKTSEDLKMSKQEVKDEHKQAEGDPLVKSAQRQMARAMAQRQMFAAIPEADLIVTNPTHFAVALRYNKMRESAPIVLARGRNLVAQKIKAIGREHGVPIIENKPVAQALYKYGKTGKSIPPQLYQAVAQILAHVYKTHRRYFADKERSRIK